MINAKLTHFCKMRKKIIKKEVYNVNNITHTKNIQHLLRVFPLSYQSMIVYVLHDQHSPTAWGRAAASVRSNDRNCRIWSTFQELLTTTACEGRLQVFGLWTGTVVSGVQSKNY